MALILEGTYLLFVALNKPFHNKLHHDTFIQCMLAEATLILGLHIQGDLGLPAWLVSAWSVLTIAMLCVCILRPALHLCREWR
mmetsp:Transcript_57824/g.135760  ORF Transcript_57824/g.135760 Transcript_57824/m.135760 type:complete len:83 (+) Transcript_57824:1248-1496(+)